MDEKNKINLIKNIIRFTCDSDVAGQTLLFQFLQCRQSMLNDLIYWLRKLDIVHLKKSFLYTMGSNLLKSRCCEKGKKFEKISHLFWHLLSIVKISGRFLQIFVAFSENLKFMIKEEILNGQLMSEYIFPYNRCPKTKWKVA